MPDDVVIARDGATGIIRLNRPDSLNALTIEMVRRISRALRDWKNDRNIYRVMIVGAGNRAFCAGGDLKRIYSDARQGPESTQLFCRTEYRLNAEIASYPKPFIAIMHGIAMGGGLGISMHGSHRVVTDDSRIAMPEVAIGLIPDVGATHVLSRAPGYCGEYLAITGETMSPADAIYAGFADAYVPAERLVNLMREIRLGAPLDETLATYSSHPGDSQLQARRSGIDATCSGGSLESCLRGLRKLSVDWAKRAVSVIEANSPLATTAALWAIRHARKDSSIVESLKREYRFVYRMIESHDFLEGIRARIIDRDNRPIWNPRTLKDCEKVSIEDWFKSLGTRELYHEQR